MSYRARCALWFLPLLSLYACTAQGTETREAERVRAGGDTTIENRTSNAYTFPAPNLSAEELELHLEGDLELEANFVSPPADKNPGLGPLFNNSACVRCHIRDGRGLPVAGTGPLGSPLIVRISVLEGDELEEMPGAPLPVPELGTQLQDHAVVGATPEATISVRWIETSGRYGDGEPFSLQRPELHVERADGRALAGDVLLSPRIPPPLFGLGLLEAVPEEELLRAADPDDADGDGISGRANYVWDVERSERVLGRFGWKANQPTLRQQAAAAYAEDMGVSSPLFPEPGGGHEIDARVLEAVSFYTASLAVPDAARSESGEHDHGRALLREAGCARCHLEELRTGEHEVAALRDQRIAPYTDLLLHNMGFDLADGRPDFLASGTEWRTPPLWGLGLAHTVLPRAGFLHDGRARTIEEAILWHGGEAELAKESFRTMAAAERAALLAFLRSL